MPTSDSGIDTIEEVLEALDTIIARALEEGSRVGYFAAVYRVVTAKIAEGIATGFFDDGERMQRLDVTLADRYLSALSRYQSGGMATRSWELALQATAASRPIMLQHLLVGINAHINLDLGIAAAETAPGRGLAGLRRDFDRINEIIASLITRVEHDIAEVSPWIGLLDWIGGRHDEVIVRFSIEVARTEAWRFRCGIGPPCSGRLGGTDRGTRRPGRPPGEEGPEARLAERGAVGDTGPGEQRRQAQHRGAQSRHRPGPAPRRGSRSARTCAHPVTGGGG